MALEISSKVTETSVSRVPNSNSQLSLVWSSSQINPHFVTETTCLLCSSYNIYILLCRLMRWFTFIKRFKLLIRGDDNVKHSAMKSSCNRHHKQNVSNSKSIRTIVTLAAPFFRWKRCAASVGVDLRLAFIFPLKTRFVCSPLLVTDLQGRFCIRELSRVVWNETFSEEKGRREFAEAAEVFKINTLEKTKTIKMYLPMCVDVVISCVFSIFFWQEPSPSPPRSIERVPIMFHLQTQNELQRYFRINDYLLWFPIGSYLKYKKKCKITIIKKNLW